MRELISRPRTLIVSCVALFAAALPGFATQAGASTSPVPTTTLLSGTYSSMAVDPVGDHVFVSLPSAGTVEVLDLSGKFVSTISGFSTGVEAANSVIYADSHIYLADTAAGDVDEIDPSTYTVDRVLATGLDQPYDLVDSNGSLWTTTGGFWPPPTLAQVNISNGQVTTYPVRLQGAGLVAGSGLPNTVFRAHAGID
jgi:hypothetical protein